MKRRALILALLVAGACQRGPQGSAAETDVRALPIGGAECAACGMVVREQPAPRAQVAYRDGTRAFTCSIADLVQYLAAPSPHGKPERVFVESLAADIAPRDVNAGTPTTWIDATIGWFVVGVDRPGAMGNPVLVYAARPDAERLATQHGGRVLGWTALPAEIMGSHAIRRDDPRH